LFKKALELIEADLKKYWMHIAIAASVIVVLQLLFGEVCWTQILFHFSCPACGMTRAMILLFTGHPIKSFIMNPLFVYVLVIFGLFVWNRYIRNRPFKSFYIHLITFFILLLIAYFIKLMFFSNFLLLFR
jgi:hypothetical protein